MKIKDVVEKTKKYEELGHLISNIETALENFDKIDTVDKDVFYINGISTFALGGSFVTHEKTEQRVDVVLSADVSNLIRDEMKVLLKKQLKSLWEEQNALEI